MKHEWNIYPIDHVSAAESIDGIARVIRKCVVCGALKITAIHENKAWREWVATDGAETIKTMPECREKNAKSRRLAPSPGTPREGTSGSKQLSANKA